MKTHLYSLTLLAALVACAAVAACEDVLQAGPAEPMLHPRDLRLSGPDQFGVVCYTFRVDALSCVQVVK